MCAEVHEFNLRLFFIIITLESPNLSHRTCPPDSGSALETLQQILLFRELQFPLKDIKKIIGSPDFDRSKALGQQIELLKLKKEHIENLIDLAVGIKAIGVKELIFGAFDTRKIDEYAAQALVKKLQDYITENFYTCSREILSGLGRMYAGGGDFTKNIDDRGGEGTAEFVHQAIEVYCSAE